MPRDPPELRVPAVLQQAGAAGAADLPTAHLPRPSAARLCACGKVRPQPAEAAGLQSAGPENKVGDVRSGDERETSHPRNIAPVFGMSCVAQGFPLFLSFCL